MVAKRMIAKQPISRRALLQGLMTSGVMAGVAPLGTAARAQTYPTRPIRMIVPFGPGSPNDVVARVLADGVSGRLGQTVVIDNRPGPGTILGMRAVATAEPDGYTLLFNSSSIVLAAAMYKDADDPLTRFTAVANVVRAPWVMVVESSVPAGSVQELIDYARKNPGTLNFGFVPGTAPQVVGEWLKKKTEIDVNSVPYRAAPQMIADLLGGRLHLYIAPLATVAPLMQQGRVRPIAFWDPQRAPQLPEVPTMIESGFPGLSLGFWAGVFAPARTPEAVVAKLNGEINAVLQSPQTMEQLGKQGLEARPGSPQEFAAFLADEMPKWAEIVRLSGVRPE
jgi:tripartite-type tricarboxylate transporter receptor subunit TctC